MVAEAAEGVAGEAAVPAVVVVLEPVAVLEPVEAQAAVEVGELAAAPLVALDPVELVPLELVAGRELRARVVAGTVMMSGLPTPVHTDGFTRTTSE
jgi:hypothetical protein